MLNNLRKNHTTYQFFVVFWEPFATIVLLERNKLFFFDHWNQQINHDPLLSSILELLVAKEFFAS